MWLLVRRLRRAGFEVLNLSYRSRAPDRARLFAAIDQFIGQQPAVLVGHSMGGLIARDYLSCDASGAHWVSHVITLGTPHRGSALAHLVCRMGLGAILYRSRHYLLARHAKWEARAHLHSIAGSLSLVPTHRLFGARASDGTVLLQETRIDGMASHSIFRSTHIGLLYSAPVAEAVIRILRDASDATVEQVLDNPEPD